MFPHLILMLCEDIADIRFYGAVNNILQQYLRERTSMNVEFSSLPHTSRTSGDSVSSCVLLSRVPALADKSLIFHTLFPYTSPYASQPRLIVHIPYLILHTLSHKSPSLLTSHIPNPISFYHPHLISHIRFFTPLPLCSGLQS